MITPQQADAAGTADDLARMERDLDAYLKHRRSMAPGQPVYVATGMLGGTAAQVDALLAKYRAAWQITVGAHDQREGACVVFSSELNPSF